MARLHVWLGVSCRHIYAHWWRLCADTYRGNHESSNAVRHLRGYRLVIANWQLHSCGTNWQAHYFSRYDCVILVVPTRNSILSNELLDDNDSFGNTGFAALDWNNDAA